MGMLFFKEKFDYNYWKKAKIFILKFYLIFESRFSKLKDDYFLKSNY
jgi:hypothetical protein